jgi:protein SCO1/2
MRALAVLLTALALSASAMAGDSIYDVSGAFKDQTGKDVRLGVERGRPVIMSMFYSSCPDACPMLLGELHRIEAALPASLRDEVRVVLVSLDPERDTPATLAKFAEGHHVHGTRWRFLTGPDSAVREVAAVLGIKFRRLSTGRIDHSSVIVVLDREGAIATRIEGITPGDPKVVARVTDALKQVRLSETRR